MKIDYNKIQKITNKKTPWNFDEILLLLKGMGCNKMARDLKAITKVKK